MERPVVRRRRLLALLAALPAVAASRQAPAQVPEPTGPQPELPRERLVIVTRDGVSHPFDVEMALTENQQTVGEMFRTKTTLGGGMLFDWGFPRPSQMWMRNTLVPLDMIFINPDGTIRTIAEDTVPRSLAVIDSGGPVRATLEVAAGTAAKQDIRVGDTVRQRIFGNAP